MKNPGSPDGQRTFRNVSASLAPSERMSSVAAAGVDAKPSSSAMVIGKNVTMTTMNEIADEIPGLVGWLGEHGYAPGGAPFPG